MKLRADCGRGRWRGRYLGAVTHGLPLGAAVVAVFGCAHLDTAVGGRLGWQFEGVGTHGLLLVGEAEGIEAVG